MLKVSLVCFVMVIVGVNYALITENCLDCIASIEDGPQFSCEDDEGTAKCGRFRISLDFYNACEIPSTLGWSWITCAFDDTCARWCLKKYMWAHQGNCSQDLGIENVQLKCHDYGRIYSAGINACSNATLGCDYVQEVRQQCYTGGSDGGSSIDRPPSQFDCE